MRIKDAARPQVTGCVERVVGLRFDVSGLDAGVGDEVCIESSGLRGQVVALDGDLVSCMPMGETHGMRVGDRVVTTGEMPTTPVGWELLGRVLDGFGEPLDKKLPLGDLRAGLHETPPHPLDRKLIREPLVLGVRALAKAHSWA